MVQQRWQQWFWLVAAFNLLFGVGALAAPATVTSIVGLPPFLDPLMTQLAGLLIAMFGVAYALVAVDLSRRELVWLGVIGKGLAPTLFIAAWWQGRIGAVAAASGAMDWVFALSFAVFLARK